MFHPYTPTHDGSVKIWLLALLVLIVGIGTSICGVYTWQHRKVDSLTTQISQLQSDLDTIKKATPSPSVPRQTYTSTKGVSISLYTPISGSTVTSPCVIVGKVPGNWSFEASFPIVLKDSSGTAIGQTTGKLLDNWMTSQPVLFSAQLPFSTPTHGSATLVLQKDNPSGLPQNDDSLSIPLQL